MDAIIERTRTRLVPSFVAAAHALRLAIGWTLLLLLRAFVLVFGRRLRTGRVPAWLSGPCGDLRAVGAEFLGRHARDRGLIVSENPESGLIGDFTDLDGPRFSASDVSWRIHEFYERTGGMALSITRADWGGWVARAARLVVGTASVAAGNLQLPLRDEDLVEGMTSRVIDLFDPKAARIAGTCWLRQRPSGAVVYSGFYGVTALPETSNPCVKTSFPIPGGWITVVLEPRNVGVTGFELRSGGSRFGEPGFYIAMQAGDEVAVTMVPLHESIALAVNAGELVAEHRFAFLGSAFLRLSYAIARCDAAVRRSDLRVEHDLEAGKSLVGPAVEDEANRVSVGDSDHASATA